MIKGATIPHQIFPVMQRGTAPQISPFSLWQNLPFHEESTHTNLQDINQFTHVRLTREIWNPILEKM